MTVPAMYGQVLAFHALAWAMLVLDCSLYYWPDCSMAFSAMLFVVIKLFATEWFSIALLFIPEIGTG